MYPVFVSDGIVLGKRIGGEENTLAAILTREYGLVRVSARAARRENSKLRYGLETLTQAHYSFIRGKYEWKLTGALKISHALVPTSPPGRLAAGRIAQLTLRLIHGEERNEALFKSVQEGLGALAQGADVEAVLVLRILSHLGYLPDTPELRPFIEQDFFSIELTNRVLASRSLLIKAINESLGSTGL
ncbi:MAG: DNA repair protein RecO (recombination protein O) [Parcubacteria group bacterium Gr01-1014_56]|nr:MAG: DNA repair protein RecO (recombination protein O) [Parcubacteria group bacterium Gr01-1014_56]